MTEQKPLEIAALGKAVSQLEIALATFREEPENTFVRDAVIQRFEFTYELAVRVLRRYLREAAISFDEVDQLNFKDLIRLGAKQELLLHGLPEWGDYRQARTETVHTYNETRAAEVAEAAYGFAAEARHLFGRVSKETSYE